MSHYVVSCISGPLFDNAKYAWFNYRNGIITASELLTFFASIKKQLGDNCGAEWINGLTESSAFLAHCKVMDVYTDISSSQEAYNLTERYNKRYPDHKFSYSFEY